MANYYIKKDVFHAYLECLFLDPAFTCLWVHCQTQWRVKINENIMNNKKKNLS